MQENQGKATVVYVNQQQGVVLDKNHDTAIALSIFLGWMGIDRMYLGQVGLGLLKLLTFGLFGIWWIIDIIMIASKNVRGVNWVKRTKKNTP